LERKERITQELSLAKRGFYWGAISGGVLSVIFSVVAIHLTGLLLVLTNISSGKVIDALIGAGAFAICAWPFSIILGVIPGLIVGSVGGIATGLVVMPFRTKISSNTSALIGLLVAISIIVVAHRYLFPGLIEPNRPASIQKYFPYLFWLGGPSLLLLSGMTWVGWKIAE
jgi:hypothetical protein